MTKIRRVWKAMHQIPIFYPILGIVYLVYAVFVGVPFLIVMGIGSVGFGIYRAFQWIIGNWYCKVCDGKFSFKDACEYSTGGFDVLGGYEYHKTCPKCYEEYDGRVPYGLL